MISTGDNRFYVYAYLDPRRPGIYNYSGYTFDHEPFYIGKGTEYRYKAHIWECITHKSDNKIKERKINKIINLGLYPIIIKLSNDELLDNEAYELESKIIKTIGRLNNKSGPLANLTDGGQGPSSIIPWNKGKVNIYSNETKIAMGAANKGKIPSDETKEKRSIKNKGQKRTEKFKINLSINRKGKNNPMFNCINENHHRSCAIMQFDLNNNFIKEWPSMMEAERQLNISVKYISRACLGIRKTASGFIWRKK